MRWHLKHFKELEVQELYKILQARINIFVIEQNCPYPECDNKDLDAYHLIGEEEGKIIAYARR